MNPINLLWNMLGIVLAYSKFVNALKTILVRLQAIHNSPNAPICDVYPDLVHEFIR